MLAAWSYFTCFKEGLEMIPPPKLKGEMCLFIANQILLHRWRSLWGDKIIDNVRCKLAVENWNSEVFRPTKFCSQTTNSLQVKTQSWLPGPNQTVITKKTGSARRAAPPLSVSTVFGPSSSRSSTSKLSVDLPAENGGLQQQKITPKIRQHRRDEPGYPIRGDSRQGARSMGVVRLQILGQLFLLLLLGQLSELRRMFFARPEPSEVVLMQVVQHYGHIFLFECQDWKDLELKGVVSRSGVFFVKSITKRSSCTGKSLEARILFLTPTSILQCDTSIGNMISHSTRE